MLFHFFKSPYLPTSKESAGSCNCKQIFFLRMTLGHLVYHIIHITIDPYSIEFNSFHQLVSQRYNIPISSICTFIMSCLLCFHKTDPGQHDTQCILNYNFINISISRIFTLTLLRAKCTSMSGQTY